MRFAVCLLALLFSFSASVAQEFKTKSPGRTTDTFEVKLAEFVNDSFNFASAEDRATILLCVQEAMSVLSPADREELAQAGIIGTTAQQNARLLKQYPNLITAMIACVPTSAQLAMRYVVLQVEGQGTASMNISQTRGFANFPGGGVTFRGGELTVAGTRVELPNFQKKLIIAVAADATVSFTVDPQP